MLNNDHESFAAAQARAAAAVSCESVVLPSGLTVLCRTMPGYSSVHAIYATGFGSVHRAFRLDGKQVTLPAGTAHFLEHKMCETPKGDSFTFYAKTGASANAFTSYDRTCYLFSATQKIDENLDILLGMVGKPWFTKATIAKEQGIIGQEIKMYDDSPDWRLLNALFRCLYADHPLRDDIAGTVESIAELTPQMLYSCTRGFYAPSNMVLSVAGKITLAQAVDACKRNGLYRARAPHEVEWDIPAQTGPLPHKEAFFTMPVTKPCFGVAYREEPLAEGDLKRELLLDMLGDLVVGGLTKLYRRLYDEALVNPEFSGDFIAVRGACTVAFTGESDTPRQVVDLLQEEIERMRREGVDPEVFMLVKNQMYGELLGDVEAVDDAAEEAAAACLKGRTLADEIAALAALTVEDANALLQTALREENRAYVQIDPAENTRLVENGLSCAISRVGPGSDGQPRGAGHRWVQHLLVRRHHRGGHAAGDALRLPQCRGLRHRLGPSGGRCGHRHGHGHRLCPYLLRSYGTLCVSKPLGDDRHPQGRHRHLWRGHRRVCVRRPGRQMAQGAAAAVV